MWHSAKPTEQGRGWLPGAARQREQEILEHASGQSGPWLLSRIERLTRANRDIHERECVNLNPATNTMNPRAEVLMAASLGTRPSLGYPGAKYEMGLEAIEEIEVLAANLACRVFNARYSEVRVSSGSLANAYAFLATCVSGDRIIVPPSAIGGHATHHREGVAGLLGLDIHEAPIDAHSYTVDVVKLATLADRVKPKLITIGGSLNLVPHPVKEIREVADAVGARVLFDAAHVSGIIAGDAWPNPLDEGAHIVTMSTYKSLGGPPSGLVLTNDETLAKRIDTIAYPGFTANFDISKTAALAVTLLDWIDFGRTYAVEMIAVAQALAKALISLDLPVFTTRQGPTTSHQFAIDASSWGGGHSAALRLREANILASAIGLPNGPNMGGLRLGTPEIVRWGMSETDMGDLGRLIARALTTPPLDVAPAATEFRKQFQHMRFVRS